MPALPIPPRVYYPRCLVIFSVIFDDQRGGPGVPATFQVVPRSVEVRRNSARQADECRLEVDYRDFPLDPRILQDVIVEVYIDDTGRDDVPIIPTRLNLRFSGRVDEPSTTLGDSQQIVEMTARDFTGIWLDYTWPQGIGVPPAPATPTLPTPPGTTLGALVELMRAQVTPQLAPAIFMDPVSAALDVHSVTGKLAFASDDDDTAWEVLSALCDLFGLVPVFELDILVIRTPTLASARSALLIYGQNVETLKFSRSLKQLKRKQVLIRCWNPLQGRAFEASYPLPGSPDYSLVTRLSEAKVPKPVVQRVQYNVEGNYTEANLPLLAQRVWTELAQQSLAGELETKEMADLLFGDSLLPLANGDVLICKLGTEDLSSIASMSFAEALAFLADPFRPNAMNPLAAAALVDAWTTAQQLSITFYITETVHKWSLEDGYRLTVRFRDFVLGV